MVKLYIDGIKYDVEEGKNLLETCLSLGYDLPYFCWHPALGSVGSCRQCAVKQFKDENDTKGKLIMSCMEPVTDNMRISISDPEAVEFRKSIIEWLMVNHPHDCPVCDEGGECHLQDMTVMTGHNYRRYRFSKRTHNNQYLGPFINHEMNRCIQCYRCVRFYRDYAGGRDFNVFSAHDHVYFGRHKDGILENEFSGNLIEVCPTGVFTDKTLKKHYTRKWDLMQAPSVCVHCSLGCNTIAAERYGSLRRILSRYNGEVNGYFLCDRGRFGYEFVNSPDRISRIMLQNRKSNEQPPAIGNISVWLSSMIRGKTAGIGSPRASLEANFMLQQLVGRENFYAGSDRTNFKLTKKIIGILTNGGVRTPSLKEIETADAIFILGEDINNTAPMMALAVRQAARQKPLQKAKTLKIPGWLDKAVRELLQEENGPVYIATPYPVKISDVAQASMVDYPDKLAEFGFSIARQINRDAPSTGIADKNQQLASIIADQLKQAEKPLIISGTGCMNEEIIEAAYNIAKALHAVNKNTLLAYAVNECNTMGLGMIAEKNLDNLIELKEKPETLIILENDLYRRKDAESVDSLLDSCKNVIVLDHLMNATAMKADIVIPSATFAESQGTLVNNEGRAQRFYKVFEPSGQIKESWKWLGSADAEKQGILGYKENYDEMLHALAASITQLKEISQHFPSADLRIAGQKIPRQSQRYSGRTSMHANVNINEPMPPEDNESPLTFSMEGYQGKPPSSLIPMFWSPGWNSAQAINKFQIEIGGHLHDGDPGIRLIDPVEKKEQGYFTNKKKPVKKGKNQFPAIPCHHIFGGEELSSVSPSINELAPSPYAGLNPDDAKKLGIKESDIITVKKDKTEYKLPVKIITGLPEGSVAIPAGLKNFYFDFALPFVIINKTKDE